MRSLSYCLDEKSRLQEAMQKRGAMPRYVFVSCEGPAHAPTFRYQVWEGEAMLGEGEGASKQLAQQAAAKNALQKLGADHCG